MFLNDCIVSFLSQFFADEQLMIFLILITRLFDSALVLLGEIFDDTKTGVHDCYLQFDIS